MEKSGEIYSIVIQSFVLNGQTRNKNIYNTQGVKKTIH